MSTPTTRTPTPCQTPGTDPDMWFPEDTATAEAAQDLCATCPLRATCLAQAKTEKPAAGIWGGELFIDGAIVPIRALDDRANALLDLEDCLTYQAPEPVQRIRKKYTFQPPKPVQVSLFDLLSGDAA